MTMLDYYVYRGEDDLQHYITPARADAQLVRLAEWLGEDLLSRSHVSTPGTVAHMGRFQAVRDYVVAEAQRRGLPCQCELIPELIGLEGHTVEGNVMGVPCRFLVGCTPGFWLPQHTAAQHAPSHPLMLGRILHRGDVTGIEVDMESAP